MKPSLMRFSTSLTRASAARHRMRTSSVVLLLTALVSAPSLATEIAATRHDDAFFDITFEAAQAKAREEGKMVMIDFFTTWCAPCRRMDETTFQDPEVTAWLRAKTVAIRVDADQDAGLKGRYKISQYPTFVFTNPIGHQRARLVGFRDATTFLNDARAALSGTGELGRARARYLAAKDDPKRRLTYAAALVRAEKYGDALEHYLWCLDHREASRDPRTDTALTNVLADIAHLAERFPPARAQLVRRRDQLAAAIALDGTTAGKVDRNAVSLVEQVRDLVAIDDTGLGEAERTLALYDRLGAASTAAPSPARVALGEALRGRLMDAKRHADIARDLGGAPGTRFDERIAAYEKQVSAAEGLPAALRRQAAPAQRTPVIQFGTMVYEVLLGTGARQEAERVASRLLAFHPAPTMREVLRQIAERVGDKKAAAALKKAG